MRTSPLLPLVLLLAVLLAACGSDPEPRFEGNLTGQVLTESSTPLIDATITVTSTAVADAALSTEAIDTTTTDHRGYFDLSLPDGTYILTVDGDGLGAHSTVEVGGERSHLELTAVELGAIRGTAAKEDAEDQDGILVYVRGTNYLAVTDSDGDYVITGVPAGSYALAARDGDYATRDDVEVTVAANATAAAAALVLTAPVEAEEPEPGAIRGVATKAGADDHGGILVSVRNTDRVAVTGPDGAYVITGLPAGSYVLTARDGDYVATGDVEVTVAAGETVDADPLELVEATNPPVIASAGSPLVFWNEMAAYEYGETTAIVIEGSGFGDTIGVSRLLYAGMPVYDAAIASWSDTRIVLEFRDPYELLGMYEGPMPFDLAVSDAGLAPQVTSGGGMIPAGEQRFEIRTLEGVAASEPVQIVHVDLDLDGHRVEPGTTATDFVEIEVEDLFYNVIEGLEFTVRTSLGSVGSGTLTTDAYGEAWTDFTPESDLPHVLSVVAGDEVVAQDVMQCCEVRIDTYEFPAREAGELRIDVETFYSPETGYQPVPGTDFGVVVQHRSAYDMPTGVVEDLGTYTTDADGVLVADLPALPEGHYHAHLTYGGARLPYDVNFDVGDPVMLD